MGIEALLGIQQAPSSRSTIAEDKRSSGTAYSGVILMLPPRPHQQIVAPVRPDELHLAGALAKPIVIPFDGAYWYFKRPDTRPKPDARVQRGDPLKANIRSTDRITLVMEAHQVLPSSIMMDCCKALRVELVNADNRPGAITIEIWLRDTSAKSVPTLSLGRVVIPSSKAHSISLKRSPWQASNRPSRSPSQRSSSTSCSRRRSHSPHNQALQSEGHGYLGRDRTGTHPSPRNH